MHGYKIKFIQIDISSKTYYRDVFELIFYSRHLNVLGNILLDVPYMTYYCIVISLMIPLIHFNVMFLPKFPSKTKYCDVLKYDFL